MKKIVAFLCFAIFIPSFLSEAYILEDTSIKIIKPRDGIYLMDKKVFPIMGQVVIGSITVETTISGNVDRVEFMVPPKVGCRPVVIYNNTSPPYSFYWNFSFAGLKDEGFMALKARGYKGKEYVAEDDIFLVRIFI